MRHPSRGLAALAFVLILAGSTRAYQLVITDLGMEGIFSQATAVNNNGQVVGFSSLAAPGPGWTRATLWDNGNTVSLGALCETCTSFANDINDSAEVVGSGSSAPGGASRALLWRNGVITALPPLLGDTASNAFSINNLGEIVGLSRGSSGSRPVRWINGMPESLGLLAAGGTSTAAAFANNDAGDIVGESSTADGTIHAFLWRDGVMTDLGGASSVSGACGRSTAFGVNESGQVVGSAYLDCTPRPAVWIDGVMQLLPPLDPTKPSGEALDINEDGDIVGYVRHEFPASSLAVLWHAGNAIYLGSLTGDATLRSAARDINDDGLIVGWSKVSHIVPYDHAVLFSVPDPPFPAAQLRRLLSQIAGIGPGRSLTSKIESALAAVESDDSRRACGTLGAFLNEVAAQSGHKLNTTQAAAFTTTAERVRTLLGC